MGTDDEAWAYDNERPAHVVDLPAFWIDTLAGHQRGLPRLHRRRGYDRPELWTADGLGVAAPSPSCRHPEFWRRPGRTAARGPGTASAGSRTSRPTSRSSTCAGTRPTPYARWAGRRLPTEAGMGEGGRWTPDRSDAPPRRFPWGDQSSRPKWRIERRLSGPPRSGAYPEGASACGAEQMIGDVWEWTSSDFTPYPGFASFPYREYSEVFFGPDYKVLRGGSWATHRQRAADHLPQLGLPDPPPDLRRLPLRPGRLTCAATWPTSVRPSPSPRCSTTRPSPWCARVGHPAASATAPSTPTATASAGTSPDAAARAGPVPPGRAHVGRPVAGVAGSGGAFGRHPGRGAQRHPAGADRGERGRPLHRRALAVVPERRRLGRPGGPPAIRFRPRRQAGIGGTSDAEVLFALLLDRLDRGVARHRRPARPGLRAARPAQPAAHRRRHHLGHGRGATPCGGAGGGRRRGGSEPLDDDPGWAAVPDRIPARGHRGHHRPTSSPCRTKEYRRCETDH